MPVRGAWPALEQRWKVSVACLTRRAHGLGMINDAKRQSLYIRLSSLPSERRREPNEFGPEECPACHTAWYVIWVVSQQQWLDEGLDILVVSGLTGLRVETLTRRLGVTKGSFYHHFVDFGDYRRALLGHYEQTCTREHLDANAALGPLSPLTRLERLADTVLHLESMHSGLEVALRAWAAQDDDARQTMARVDGLRTTYIEGLLAQTLGDRAAAHDLARSIYYVHVGSQQTQPPATPEEVRRLYSGFLDQVARASTASPAPGGAGS